MPLSVVSLLCLHKRDSIDFLRILKQLLFLDMPAIPSDHKNSCFGYLENICMVKRQRLIKMLLFCK